MRVGTGPLGSGALRGNSRPDRQVSRALAVPSSGPGARPCPSRPAPPRPSPVTVRPVCLELPPSPLAAPGALCRRVPERSGARTSRRSFFTQLLETSTALGPHSLLAGTPGSRGSGSSTPRPGAGRAWTLGRGRSRGSGTMNGHGVGRAPGYSLNGAGEFYCEAVEGAQNPGGLLLSPAAFINPAQYASVLEGRFKQLQGGLRGWGGGLREEGSGGGGHGWSRPERGPPRRERLGAWERSRSQAPGVGGASSVTQTVCVGRQSAGGIITSGREIRGR